MCLAKDPQKPRLVCILTCSAYLLASCKRGACSTFLQGLGAPITDIYRLRSTDQRLYLYATRNPGGTVVMGGLKIGSKKLFVRTVSASLGCSPCV